MMSNSNITLYNEKGTWVLVVYDTQGQAAMQMRFNSLTIEGEEARKCIKRELKNAKT